MSLPRTLRTDQDQGGAVDDAGAVATGVDVVDLLEPVVLLQGHVVEPGHRSESFEGRLQLAETLNGGTRPHVLVVVEDDQTVHVLHGHDGLREVAARPCFRGPLLGARGVCVDVLAGESLDGGDQVGADALRDDVVVEAGGGIGEQRAAVGAHRYAAHRLDAARDHQVVPARTHLLRCGVDGLEAGGAEPVELHTSDGVGHARGDHRGARDVGALVADRGDHAEDDVADRRLVQIGVAGAQLVDESDHQIQWLDLVEGAVLVLAARRANGLVDEGFFRHEDVPVQMGLLGDLPTWAVVL